MNIVRNILAVIAGLIVGNIVNMSLIMVSGSIIPPPEGMDNTTMEGLMEGMKLLEAKHYIFPFLAHALGTLAGAIIASLIAIKKKWGTAMIVGTMFLAGGVYMVYLLPSPMWFNLLDLIVAYIPMAWLGNRIVTRRKAN